MADWRGRVVVLLGCLVAMCDGGSAALADWPQFLGSDSNAMVRRSPKLSRAWPEGGPEVLWQIPVGPGYGGPAIYRDSVLLLDREGESKDVVRRVRLSDGQEIWRFPYDAPGKLDHHGSRSTPATDGQRVYCIGPFGQVHAVSFADGKPVWKAHLLDDWGATRPNWGVATSPLLYRDLVIVAPWGSKAAVVAYDRATGQVKWTAPNPKGIQLDYSTPVPAEIAGTRMILASGKEGYTIGIDPSTGRQLWEYAGYSCRIHIPSPTHVGDGRILLTGGYRAGAAMFQVAKEDAGFSVRELWKKQRGAMGSKLPQPLVYGGFIYGNSSDDRGGLRCITPEGDVKWETGPNLDFDMGSVLLADGLIFVLDGRNGDLRMVEADPSGYKELGRLQLLKAPEVWAPMAMSGTRLLIRDQHTLACLNLRAPRR